ncbi:unnamed protein product [Rotaria sp. Silwood2]|nr:unnamed protein product [Rotaria sp. Silwood2]CAF4369275.1 unnamed protein product [Rotaria sp. Silwood2]
MITWILQDEHLLATILHPQIKHFDKNPSDKSRAMQLLQNEIEKCTKTNQSSSSNLSSCAPVMMFLPTSSSEEKRKKAFCLYVSIILDYRRPLLMNLPYGCPRH